MWGIPCTQQGRTAQSEYLTALGEQLTDAMSVCSENKKLVKFEHVDIGAELQKRGLLNIWPSEVLWLSLFCLHDIKPASKAWPPSLAVGKLAATLKKRRKQGQQNVFVCVDLRECAAGFPCLFKKCGDHFDLEVATASVQPSQGPQARRFNQWQCKQVAVGPVPMAIGVGPTHDWRGCSGPGGVLFISCHEHL